MKKIECFTAVNKENRGQRTVGEVALNKTLISPETKHFYNYCELPC